MGVIGLYGVSVGLCESYTRVYCVYAERDGKGEMSRRLTHKHRHYTGPQ